MKRTVIFLFIVCVAALALIISNSSAQRNTRRAHVGPAYPVGKISVPCPAQLTDITDCPETGCGPSLDPLLNKQKNIRSDDQTPEPMTIQEMKDLPDPVESFEIGDSREKLEKLGEGKKIVVVANALAVRKGGGESCNCKLTSFEVANPILTESGR